MNNSENANKKAAIEAVLFTMGQAVSASTLTHALEITEEELSALIAEMQAEYEAEDRGIRLIRLEDAYQLCTKKEYYETLIRVASEPRRPVLTEVMMEVLSIISYRQPVTRGEIERIRGVSSDYSVNRLIEYGLIEEKGRQESPGRPILFGTTEEFLRKFGLSSVKDLPPIREDLMGALKELEESDVMEGQLSFDMDRMSDVPEEEA